MTSPSPSTTKTTLLDGSAWIRDNTRADIDYLVARSGASDITPANHTRVISEIAATIPPNTDPTILDALCPTLS